MEKEIYRVIAYVQFSPEIDDCHRLFDGKGYGTVYSDGNGEAVIDYLKELDGYFDYTEGDFYEEKPYIARGTDSVYEKDGYTLLYNSSICGNFMLYRKADESEIEWWSENCLRSS